MAPVYMIDFSVYKPPEEYRVDIEASKQNSRENWPVRWVFFLLRRGGGGERAGGSGERRRSRWRRPALLCTAIICRTHSS